jgi:hypothetical protein
MVTDPALTWLRMICLQTATVLRLGERIPDVNCRGVNVVRQKSAVHTAEPPVPKRTGSEGGMASENRNR